MSTLIDDVLANPIIGAAATALALAGVAMWLAAAWWVWRDANRRTESSTISYLAVAWVLISTPLLLPLSLAIYAVARPSITAAEHRAQSLIAALSADAVADSACPGCAAFVEHEWHRCPQCATWLAAPCSSCGEWSPAGLELCPFCGREGREEPVVDADVVRRPAGAGRAGNVAPRGVAARLGVPVPRRAGA